MDDRNDIPHRRLQPAILLARAAIPHVIWGQDAVHYSLGGAFIFYDELDLQILIPPSRTQGAVTLLTPSYSPMSCDEIDEEKRAYNSSHLAHYTDYTLAFRDRPNDFVRLKSLQRNTRSDPSRVLLISNTIFNYPLDETVPISLLLCPILPFPSVPVLFRLMPVHEMAGYCAINFSFPKELEEEYYDADELPARLKEMMICLDEREKRWVYDCFLLGSDGSSAESSSDESIPLKAKDGTTFGTKLPTSRCGPDPSRIASCLRANGVLLPNGRWALFPKDPAEASGEGETFKHLENIATAIVKEAAVLLNSEQTATMQTEPRQAVVLDGHNGQFISGVHYALYDSLGARVVHNETATAYIGLCQYDNNRKVPLTCDRTEI
ncbi:uncharacterized protein ARMOST_05016 [Armillaria ostoyae]|uniref:Uncharacterized protein n=1 Tax=Armillaria ostoyae TaxID=47428 RepID=A0A284QYZ5_ARMOS|nr:uncharacterized protein ARMOST_05016 [Armillaria ostoyae]